MTLLSACIKHVSLPASEVLRQIEHGFVKLNMREQRNPKKPVGVGDLVEFGKTVSFKLKKR